MATEKAELAPEGLSDRLSLRLSVMLLLVWLVLLCVGGVFETGMTSGWKLWLWSVPLFSGLFALSVIDLRSFRLPDYLTLPLGLIGLAFVLVERQSDVILHLVGAGVAYLIVYGLHSLWKIRSGRAGIGLGDAKLLAVSGIWCGIFAIPLIFLICSGTGLIVTLLIRLFCRSAKIGPNAAIPFGPFIATGLVTYWVFEDLIRIGP